MLWDVKLILMWLPIAIIAYFLNAGVYTTDKFFLSKKVHSSISYAFYVGVWSIFNIFLLILDPWMPTGREFMLDALAGILFLATLVFWYKALHQSEATRVVPVVGALVPIFSFIFTYIFFGESLSERHLLAFLILVIGGVLISVKQTRVYMYKEVKESLKNKFGGMLGNIHAIYRPTGRLIMNSVVSAIFFSAYYVLIKHIYTTQPFIGAFVWSRVGGFIGVLFLLFVSDWRQLIVRKKHERKTSIKGLIFFIFVRLMAAAAFIMLNWAISMGNVAIVNSLQGVQYVFLFLLVLFLTKKYPDVLKEELGGNVLFQKLVGIVLILLGVYMMAT